MGFFEWWGESFDPGGAGTVKVQGDDIRVVWVGFTLVRFAVTLVAFVGLPLVATFWEGGVHPLWGLATGAAFLAYLLLGYFVRPQPDTSNIGFLGGLIDHPFRYTDDWNRTLMVLVVVLLPGYLLARPVAEVFFWLSGEAVEEDRRRTG